jgi:hypothetical protein
MHCASETMSSLDSNDGNRFPALPQQLEERESRRRARDARQGTLENAQAMAAHESPRTTKLYDRTGDEITLDEIERITI